MEAYQESKVFDIGRIREINQNSSREVKVWLAARYYGSLGWRVVPLLPNTKQLPGRAHGVNYGHASSNIKTIDKWFHPDNGRFKGWNIGIACGCTGGAFAIDVDKHGEIDGFKTLAQLQQEYGDLPAGPVQETPGGGKHYLFNWQENASCTTGKIGPGIDTRGGEENTCRGHIVAWPSVVDSGEYRWVAGGPIPDIPKWVMDRLGVAWRPPSNRGRGNENVGEDDIETPVPKEQIEQMLAAIPIDLIDYDEWLRIGMSLKYRFPGEEGLEIWDNWSKTGKRYKNGECQIRWDKLNSNNAVRMGTLFYIAKKYGWEPKPDDVKGNKYDQLVAEMNETHAIVVVGGKIRIIREKNGVANDFELPYDLMDKESFKLLYSNSKIMVVTKDGKAKHVSIADVWLAHPNRRTYPEGMGMYPSGAPDGYYNTWRGFTVDARQGDCTLFLNHIRDVICNGDNDIYEWVLDWLADLVQEPDRPKGTAIVMRGKEGTGKGIFANTIGRLFGPHFLHLIDENHLLSNFNAHLLDAILVFADEITWGGNRKTASKLKGMVTEDKLVGERKGVDAVTYRNMIHLIVASNDKWVIPAGTNSRRWLVLEVSDRYIGNNQYFDSVLREINNGGLEALLHFLLNRKITNKLNRAPSTEALEEQRAMSISTRYDSVESWWQETIEIGIIKAPAMFVEDENKNDDWPSAVLNSDLFNSYVEWCKDRGNTTPVAHNVFGKTMRKLGVDVKRKRVPGGKFVNAALIPSREECIKLFNREMGSEVIKDEVIDED